MKKTLLSRKDLYDLIWSKSWFDITDQFDLSMFRLLKICKENRVPAPSDDWWTETTIKEIAYKPELYVDDSCRDDAIIEIVSDREIRQTRINEIKEDIEESCGEYLSVPTRLFSPDQLILNAKYSLEDNKPSSSNRDEGSAEHVSIFVTKKNIGRSLRILDTFIKLIKIRGHSIEMDNHEYKIHIGAENYEFSIREKYKKVENKEKWHDYDYVPTGLLVLSVGRWSDKKEFVDSGIPIEKKLSYALAYLEYTAEEGRHSMEVNETHRKKREEEERIAQEIKERETQEIERFNNLIKQANEWNQARLLREFINEVESKTTEMNQESEIVHEWIKWAQARINDYDPLSCGLNTFLSEVVSDQKLLH
jgi:hypothetical protein